MSKLVTVPLSEIEPIRENGIIYAINALVLHPLGYAIAYSYKDDGGPNDPPIAMILMKTDDGEAFGFEESHGKEAKARLLKFLESLPTPPSNLALLKSIPEKS